MMAQSKTNSTIQSVLEAITLHGVIGDYWIGGRENAGDGIGGWLAGEYLWTEDNSIVDNTNWAIGHSPLGLSILFKIQNISHLGSTK